MKGKCMNSKHLFITLESGFPGSCQSVTVTGVYNVEEQHESYYSVMSFNG